MSQKKYQIFISSTYEDLKEERDAAIKTILSLDHIPIGMKMFNAGDEEQWAVICRTIDSSDYYAVIIGLRYGTTTDLGTSYTEMEYDYAISQGIPVLTFIKDENAPSTPAQRESDFDKQQKLSDFREKAKKKIAKFWKTKDEFTTMLSTSLHQAFIQIPRTGWISAGFDPMVMGREIATLSKENRELRKQLDLLEMRKPQLEFSLESEEDLCFTFTHPQFLVRHELSPDDISQELIDDLEAQDRIIEASSELLGQILSKQKSASQENENQTATINVAKTDYRKQIMEEIAAYNVALPSQREFDDYNTKNVRYVNITENFHKVNICIENSGTISANQVTVTLRFPPELLVFDDCDIEETEKPEKLEIPNNPLYNRNDTKFLEALTQDMSFAHAFSYSSKLKLSAALLSHLSSGRYYNRWGELSLLSNRETAPYTDGEK